MKVIILGGYGVFGSRLAELLVRDGHEVVVSGRDTAKLTALAERLGCYHQQLDHRSDPEAIFVSEPQVVVDAAGPYQSYDKDPYVIPRLCLQQGADYLDLSDDADFTQGIAQFDEVATASGRRLLSGASSVPGISSSVVADLATDLDEIQLIDSAILPGNRAPRGVSVIASIVGQLGSRSRVLRAGHWRQQHCWADASRIRLAEDINRTARYIEVPDIRLFPDFFQAKSVIFRAGLELPVLNWAMLWIALLRRRWRFAVTPGRAQLLCWLANLLLPFGSDRGGMRVLVVGRRGGVNVKREWRLIAEAGDGPYIPAITARTLIGKLEGVTPGARPCLAEATRGEVEAAMSDLNVSCHVDAATSPCLMQTVLADRWQQLPPEAQALHDVQDVAVFSGSASVTRGKGLIARLVAWLFRFPPAAEQLPVTVTKTRTAAGETWERNFGGKAFLSRVAAAPEPYHFRERFGPFSYELELEPSADGMGLPVRRGWLLGMPLPLSLLPKSESREYVQGGRFHFDVGLTAPLGGGLIVRYRGQLRPA